MANEWAANGFLKKNTISDNLEKPINTKYQTRIKRNKLTIKWTYKGQARVSVQLRVKKIDI